ncbi:putative transporter [Porphyromonas loveana]|uniref:Putative transport protein n=1 Tax=Porphyromonas loveana TaxID=1884669 RepID=A0A2U1FKL9_9PORP|nr:putative transporter [Porphyromonas loveana]PVZ12707.1 putative transport protein [Porphyromonas loveana]
MQWLNELLFGTGVGHSILLVAVTIALGIWLGKVKIFGVSLGVTFVLFVGIILGHFGMHLNHDVQHFFKEFGLILFVYSVGMQVGPGFFSSLRKGGLMLNMLAVGVVSLGVVTSIVLHFVTGLPMSTMVGILSGAVTNTPGLGAAEQTLHDLTGASDPTITLGYAVAYPLGVVGIITSMLIIRAIFRINMDREKEVLDHLEQEDETQAMALSLVVKNPAVFSKTLGEVHQLLKKHDYVISRTMDSRTNNISPAHSDTVLHEDDRIFVITNPQNAPMIINFIGTEVQMDRKQWIPNETNLISRRFIVTKSELNGRKLGSLQLRKLHGMNVTRVNRAGVEMVASASLPLQVGDRITVVGSEVGMQKVEELIGNSVKRLNEPNLIAIFVGIGLGILLGSIPIILPGIPQPVKLGLAGGPLVVAILLSRFGYRYKLVTYTTPSANLMLREVGIAIFLACVGIGAGDGFVDTIVNKGGFTWVGYGILITLLPLLIIGFTARKGCKVNFLTLMGLMAGSMTDPPALAYATNTGNHDSSAVGYATVYPLTMFLRVLTAQLLILFFCS